VTATAAPAPAVEPARRRPSHRLALVLDPRFPGGTSVAAAAEIRALAGVVDLRVVALETAMFPGRGVHPALEAALADHGLDLVRDPPVVHADTIVVHNPSCLRFDDALDVRMSCARAVVVTHENFLRPNGAEAFDVAACLALLETALVCAERVLAPVSSYNRRTVADWLAREERGWALAAYDWFNIVDLEPRPPTSRPRDRRGRHSRPGFEKFPSFEVMRAHFPPHAEACIILGGDGLLLEPAAIPPHWDVRRFAVGEVAACLREIDFFVYFTNPLWRESFGRVVAEAIAAGKVVITDPATATSFGDAVIACDGAGDDVDRIIAELVAAPARYAEIVARAQEGLTAFRPEAFVTRVLEQLPLADASRRAVV
jgi:hypothetical protein